MSRSFWDIGKNFAEGATKTFVEAGGVGINNSQELLGKGLEEFNPTIFTLMENLHKIVFIPVASAILCIGIFNEFYNILVSKNAGHEGYVLDAVRVFIKLIMTMYLIVKSFVIVNGIFKIGVWGSNKISEIAGINGEIKGIDITTIKEIIDKMDNWEAFGMGIILYLLSVVIFFVGVYSYVFVLAWLYECYLFIVGSPIPLGAYVTEEHKSMATNYLKDIMALAIQGALFVVIYAVYRAMMSGLTLTGTDTWKILLGIVTPPFLLMTMYGKMGSLAKQIVGKS